MSTKQEKLAEDRKLRKEMKRPRDWAELWWAYILHFIQGFICGFLGVVGVKQGSTPLALLSLACVVQYGAYQGISYARKKDTPGRDLADFGAGYAVGGLVAYFLSGV